MRKRADVIVHFSATAFKRVLKYQPAQKNMSDWFGRVRTVFVDSLGASKDAWIRRRLPGDGDQWTMIVYWAPKYPDQDWNKGGFIKLGSDEGSNEIRDLSLTGSEKKDAA